MHIVTTHEYENAGKVKLDLPFIDFATCEQAILWYCGLIKRLYPESYGYRKERCPFEYFRWLVLGDFRYATDPTYSQKLIDLYGVLSEQEKYKKLLAYV